MIVKARVGEEFYVECAQLSNIIIQSSTLKLFPSGNRYRVHALVLCAITRVLNHSPLCILPLLQLPGDQRRNNKRRVNGSKRDPALVVSGRINLLEYDQWQPGRDSVAELVHRADHYGALFVIRARNFVSPAKK